MGLEPLAMTVLSISYIGVVGNGLGHVPTADLEIRRSLMERLEKEGLEPFREDLARLDPDAYATMDLSNVNRVFRAVEICLTTGKPYSSFKEGAAPAGRDFEIEKVGLTRPREDLYDRINRRVVQMVDDGLVQEVRSLAEYRHLTALQTVGYKEVFDYLDGACSLDEAVGLIQRNTRHYAKRQLTWWRRDPSIRWIAI